MVRMRPGHWDPLSSKSWSMRRLAGCLGSETIMQLTEVVTLVWRSDRLGFLGDSSGHFGLSRGHVCVGSFCQSCRAQRRASSSGRPATRPLRVPFSRSSPDDPVGRRTLGRVSSRSSRAGGAGRHHLSGLVIAECRSGNCGPAWMESRHFRNPESSPRPLTRCVQRRFWFVPTLPLSVHRLKISFRPPATSATGAQPSGPPTTRTVPGWRPRS